MIVWGLIWGAILGFFLGGYSLGLGVYFGAMLGALAGNSLRSAIRTEIELQREKWGQSVASSPVKPPDNSHIIDPVPAVRPVYGLSQPERMEYDGHHDVTLAVSPKAEASNAAASIAATILPPAIQSVAPERSTSTEPQPPPPVRHRDPRPPIEPDLSQDFITRIFGLARDWLFGGNTIVRMGLVVLFVGLAFLAKYAIDNSLLPPELRLTGIGLTGIALFVFGFRLRAKDADKLAYALTLQGGGVAVFYLTVFAAFRLYQLLPGNAAFVLLALVCIFSTAIALMQNAMAMAFIGFAGAFAAPMLVSTGQGSHVALFSYFLLLNLAIAAVAWLRAWRALNLLGFFSTFGVATLWGVLKYQPDQFMSTEPFLILFFLIYVVASLLYATRHSLAPKQAVDATLIFGTPLVAFGLQFGMVKHIEYATAFSSLIMGGFYLLLGLWALRGANSGSEVRRWLAECFVALGIGFVTLAVPLAFDARWTSAVWAIEGAAVYWMGHRQGRWLARLVGLALQPLAAFSYLSALDQTQMTHPDFFGATLLAIAALILAHWSRNVADDSATAMARQFSAFEKALSPVWVWIGFFWWQFALGREIDRFILNSAGEAVRLFDHALRGNLHMLAWLASAFALHYLARPERLRPWSIAATPSWFTLPVMLLVAFNGMKHLDHVFQSLGWLIWPLALMLHLILLRRLDSGAPQGWWSWVHSGGVWLVMLLFGNLLLSAVQRAELHHTAWASVILLVAATVVLLVMSQRTWFDPASSSRARWPLDRFASAYLVRASIPLGLMIALGCLVVAVHSNGNAQPLPYVPILNPTDLSVALGLAACSLWMMRLRQSTFELPDGARYTHLPLVLAAIAFIAINTVWLRVAHQYAGVRWDAQSLFNSFLVQAGYSILWTLLALGLMIAAHQRQTRSVWKGGAVLLGVTVLKLFMLDLSNRGGSERIVVFIAVGLLMLVVGYFAPLPPPDVAEEKNSKEVAP